MSGIEPLLTVMSSVDFIAPCYHYFNKCTSTYILLLSVQLCLYSRKHISTPSVQVYKYLCVFILLDV